MISRRQFLLALAGAAVPAGADAPPDIVVAKGGRPAENCRAAVDALGGFSRFVRPGDRVVVKPNPLGTRRPEAGLHTHPDMVEAVIRGCREAGAREVIALSHDSRRFFLRNGTADAVERSGGILQVLETEDQFRPVIVPRGRILRREQIASAVLDADVFINLPIAKHHGETHVTVSMKNLMGINWNRGRFHETDLEVCIAELASCVHQDLILVDANHVLRTNGPMGPGEVLEARQVIAGIDPVAVDAFAARTFWPERTEIRHIRTAYDLGVGEIDLARLNIHEVTT